MRLAYRSTVIHGSYQFGAAIILATLGVSFSASAADPVAGKTKVDQSCAECHRPKDWTGESAPALEALMKDIVTGKIKHSKKRLQLSQQDIENIAAYWTSGRSPARN